MSLLLRYMHPTDAPQVVAIDELSFPDAWSLRSYLFEINESKVSHMLVVEESHASASEPPPHTVTTNPLQRWLNRLMGKPSVTPATAHTIVAYSGLWQIAEEAHISTIASHPNQRGKGYGELALAGMLMKAMTLGAGYVVLEVRVSNHVAQALYKKYGFVVTDTNYRYYRDGEDAYDMRLELTESATRDRLTQFYQALHARLGFHDQYSTVKHPRLG